LPVLKIGLETGMPKVMTPGCEMYCKPVSCRTIMVFFVLGAWGSPLRGCVAFFVFDFD